MIRDEERMQNKQSTLFCLFQYTFRLSFIHSLYFVSDSFFSLSFSPYRYVAAACNSTHKPTFRFFRVIPAREYLAEFSSDRRHMKRTDGTWIKHPPSYVPIQSSGKSKMQIISKYFSKESYPKNNNNNKIKNKHLSNEWRMKWQHGTATATTHKKSVRPAQMQRIRNSRHECMGT